MSLEAFLLMLKCRSRYAAVGICCGTARFGALLGVLLAHLRIFFEYPLGIAGVCFVVSAFCSLWLPDTLKLNDAMPIRFRRT